MSSTARIPPELYYLDPTFSLRTARKYQLLDILDSNGVKEYKGEAVSDKFTRIKLMHVFKDKILPKKNDIIREYNRKQIEEILRTDTEDNDSEELSEEDDLSELDEETINQEISELEDQNNEYDDSTNSFFRISTGKRIGESSPERIYPVLDDQDSNLEIPENANSFQLPTDISHRWPLRSRNADVFGDYYSEDVDVDYIPENYDEDSDSEEDFGDISKDEVFLLKKDQDKPPEPYDIPKFHMETRAQKTASMKEQLLMRKQRLMLTGGVFGIFLFSVLTAIIFNTVTQRNKNGYCQNYPIIPESNSTGIFRFSSPCIPCPDHGICKNGELICEALYERRTPFYNIGNMLPIADECVHNSVLGRYVGRVERNIKRKLAVHQGDMVCAYLISHPEYTEEFPVAKLPVKELLEKVRNEEQNSLPEDRLDEIMILALTAVMEDPETRYTEMDGERFIGINKTKFTLGCRLKRWYHSLSLKAKLCLLLLVTFILSTHGIYKDYKNSKAYKSKIDKLVKDTMNKLKKQAQKHAQDKSISPAISAPQLRSFIVDVNNQQTIKDWQKVQDQIRTNPHVRKCFQEVRGDPVEFWELIS